MAAYDVGSGEVNIEAQFHVLRHKQRHLGIYELNAHLQFKRPFLLRNENMRTGGTKLPLPVLHIHQTRRAK